MAASIRRQKGLGTLGWLVAILVGGLAVMLALKLTPVYLDDYAVSRVLSSLDSRPGAESAGVSEVREWFRKGLQTNLIKLEPGESKIYRSKSGGVTVEVNYERRLHFLYNIDLVLTFEHYWNVKSQ